MTWKANTPGCSTTPACKCAGGGTVGMPGCGCVIWPTPIHLTVTNNVGLAWMTNDTISYYPAAGPGVGGACGGSAALHQWVGDTAFHDGSGFQWRWMLTCFGGTIGLGAWLCQGPSWTYVLVNGYIVGLPGNHCVPWLMSNGTPYPGYGGFAATLTP